jgi:cyclophilin family peptidyl-prolyl cis-trans isomerase
MGTEKRERQKAARSARLEAEAVAQKRSSTLRRGVIGAVAVALVVVFIFVVSTGDSGDDDVVATDDTTPADNTTPIDPTEPREFTYGAGECPPEEGSDAQVQTFAESPQQCIDPDSADYRATVTTSMGDVVIDLYDDRAPGTVNNFVTLARYRYFEDVIFHRIIEGFVNQGGDPDGTGAGGPGYQIPDELPASLQAYVEGSVAMANAGPDTGGSQWFVWFESPPLPGPSFSFFGQVTDDTLDVARSINQVETGDGDRPVEDVTILSVTIEELPDGTIDDDAAWDRGTTAAETPSDGG